MRGGGGGVGGAREYGVQSTAKSTHLGTGIKYLRFYLMSRRQAATLRNTYILSPRVSSSSCRHTVVLAGLLNPLVLKRGLHWDSPLKEESFDDDGRTYTLVMPPETIYHHRANASAGLCVPACIQELCGPVQAPCAVSSAI